MTSAEQTEAIRQSMQDEKATKDELVRELVEALEEARESIEYWSQGGSGFMEADNLKDDLAKIDAALRKAGAL